MVSHEYAGAIGQRCILAPDGGTKINADGIANASLRASLKEFENVPGVYVHEFNSGTVYVGQAKNLADRPVKSLNELLDAVRYKGTAANAGDTYSGRTFFIKLQDSGFKDLNALENSILQDGYGGTMNQGGNTYNIRRIPGQ